MNNVRKLLAKIMVMVMILSLFNGFSLQTYAANDPELILNLVKEVSNQAPKAGESFTYTIKWSTSGTYNGGSDLTGLQLIETLDDDLEIVTYDTGSLYDVSQSTDGKILTYDFKNGISTGKSGIIKVVVKFKEGKTPKGATDEDSEAIFKINDNQNTAKSPVATVQIVDKNDIDVVKKASPPNPALDNFVVYTIKVTGEASVGGRNLENVVVTDTLPAGVSNVEAITAGGNYDASNNTVTWTGQEVRVGQTKTYQLKCKYLAADGFQVGDNVTNDVLVEGTQVGESNSISGTASLNHSFTQASMGTFGITKHNRSGAENPDKYAKGQTAKFRISGVENAGNVPLDNICVIDKLPENSLKLKSIYTGSYNSNVDVKLFYTTDMAANPIVWQEYTNTNVSANTNVIIQEGGGVVLDDIKGLKIQLGEASASIPIGFALSSPIRINAEVTADVSTTVYTNEAWAISNMGTESFTTPHATADFMVKENIPKYAITLSSDKNAYDDSENIKYTITFKNGDLSRGDIQDAIVGVKLNTAVFDDYQELNHSVQIEGNQNVTIQALPDKTDGNTVYKLWQVNGFLKPSDYVNIKFKNSIVNGQSTGKYDAVAFVVTEGVQDTDWWTAGHAESEPIDFDDDGVNDTIVSSAKKIFNKFQGTVIGEKSIMGELDNNYLVTDLEKQNGASTLAGGYVNYKLKIANTTGNGPVSNVVIVDRLPRKNDTYITDGRARGSTWSPYLIGKVKLVEGDLGGATYQIYYSTKDNPDISILKNPTKSVNTSDWTTTAPENIIDVTNIMIKLNGEIAPSKNATFEFKMIAPFGANLNSKTHNSFAYGATYPDENGDAAFLPSEPSSVYHKIAPEGSDFGIGKRVFYDVNNNGLDDDVDKDGKLKGINGIKVVLYKTDKQHVERYTYSNKNVADEDGYYLFPKTLEAGNYDVVFLVPKSEGYHLSAMVGTGSDDPKDSDFGACDFTQYALPDDMTAADVSKYDAYSYSAGKGAGSFLGVSGSVNKEKYLNNISLGLYKYTSISGKVYNDKNHNGIKDAGEEFLSDKTLTLSANGTSQTAVTDASGGYSFASIPPANYNLKLTLPDAANWTFSQTVDNASQLGNDFTNAGATINSLSDDDGIVKNAGIHRAMIEGEVFFDANYDGNKVGANETGLSGITVKLLDASDNVVATTTTSANGRYSFVDLNAGNYKVEVGASGFHPTKKANGAFVANKSFVELDGAKQLVKNVQVAKGARLQNVNAGYYKDITVQGYLFNDLNNNGQKDADEKEKFNNVTTVPIQILGGELASPITVNANFDATSGKYSYAQVLKPSVHPYTLSYTNPDPAHLSPAKLDTNSNTINSANNKSVFAGQGTNELKFTLTNPVSHKNGKTYYINSGLRKSILEINLFEDMNYDGNSAGEAFLNGLASGDLELVLKEDANVIETLTPNTMNSVIANLDAGVYSLELKIKKDKGFKPSKNNTGEHSVSGEFDVYTYNNINMTKGGLKILELGFYIPASIETEIFNDKNYNGAFDAGEEGTGLVSKVTLVASDGSRKDFSKKPSNQHIFELKEINPDVYSIEYTIVSPYGGTKHISVPENGKNALAKGNTKLENVVIQSGDKIVNIDVGLYKQTMISGSVYHDKNANGTKDSGEGVIPVKVELLDDSGQVVRTLNNVNGAYSFDNLPEGKYKVRVTKNGYETAESNEMDIVLGDKKTVELGIYKKTSIAGKVFWDKNRNGIDDAGDAVFSDISVELLKDGNVQSTKNVKVDGSFEFANLVPDDYTVRIVIANDKKDYYKLSPKDVGSDDTKDSDIDPSTLTSDTMSPLSDASFNVGVGIYRVLNISGTLTDEAGHFLKGSKVHLLKDDGTPVLDANGQAVIAIADNDGKYAFLDLYSGSYKLLVESTYQDGGNVVKYPDIKRDIIAPEGGHLIRNFVCYKYQIEFKAEPKLIVGDGKSKSKLTFTIKDQNGNPLPNQAATFDAGEDLLGAVLPANKQAKFANNQATISVNTNANGEAILDITSANLEGYLVPQTVKIKAKAVLPSGKHLEDFIIMEMEPISISGTVKGEGNKVYAGVDVKISQVIDKDVLVNDDRIIEKDGYKLSDDGNGKFLFEYVGKTDADGNYKIFVPFSDEGTQNHIDYNVEVVIPSEQSATGSEISFKQNAKVESVNGAGGQEDTKSTKTIAGTVQINNLVPKNSGNPLVTGNGEFSIEYEQGAKILKYTINNNGKLVADPANPSLTNASYTRKIYYKFNSGEKICIAKKIYSQDDISHGDLLIEDILIDPYGTIKKAGTSQVVEGAKVTLHYNDGTLVPLPKTSLGLSNNDNPQLSNEEGKYGWMVFPNKDYYIIAEKVGFHKYDSRNDGGYQDDSATLSKGLIHVGLDIVKWDFEMKPIIKKSSSGGSGSSSSSEAVPKNEKTSVVSVSDENKLLQEISLDKNKGFANDVVEVLIEYQNNTDSTIQNPTLKVQIPAGVQLVDTVGAVYDNGYLYYKLNDIQSGKGGKKLFKISFTKDMASQIYPFESVIIDDKKQVISDFSHAYYKLYAMNEWIDFDGYIYGRPDGKFHKTANISRAEVAAILVRLSELDVNEVTTVEFKDVKAEDWFYDDVRLAVAHGYFNGSGNGMFKPNDAITREELAKVLANYYQLDAQKEGQLSKKFTDTDASFAQKEIEVIARYKMVSGYPDATFRPKNKIIRSEAVAMFNRLFYRYPTPDVEPSFYDMEPSNWEFGEVESAFRGFRMMSTENGTVVQAKDKKNPYYDYGKTQE